MSLVILFILLVLVAVTCIEDSITSGGDCLPQSYMHDLLGDVIGQGIVDGETAAAYIDQLKATIDQQKRTNIEILRLLNGANTFNIQQATAIAEQQRAVIAEQEVVVGALNQAIKENAVTFQRMHRVLQERDATSRMLTDRVVALEQVAARLAPPTVMCKPWIVQVYDLIGLTSLFGRREPADIPRCQPLVTQVYDAIFGPL